MTRFATFKKPLQQIQLEKDVKIVKPQQQHEKLAFFLSSPVPL